MSITNTAPTTTDLATLHRENLELAARVARLEKQMSGVPDKNALSICVFSDDLDRLLAAFSIANSSAACGMQVTMYFTFWATSALKRTGPQAAGKTIVERMFGWMLPGGPKVRSLSKLQMGGMGRAMVEREMRLKGIAGLAEQMEMAKSTGIQILVCSMTMDLMGIRREELVEYPGLEVCGTTKFIDIAASGNVTFFI